MTLILVFGLLSAVGLGLAVPVEKTRSRQARDISFEERPVFPVQPAPSDSVLMPVYQFGGMQLNPYRFTSIMRPPHQPAAFYSHSYPYPYSYLYLRPRPYLYPPPPPHPHPPPPLFPFRPGVAVQPPIIVLERVPSTNPTPTAGPPATNIPVG